jgi:hypothetical protein
VYDVSKSTSIVIVICPSPMTRFRKRIMEMLEAAESRSQLLANPVIYHMSLISTYFSSWRSYLGHFEMLLSSAVSEALVL